MDGNLLGTQSISRSDAVILTVMVLSATITTFTVVTSFLWKAFNLIGELKLLIAETRSQLLIIANKVAHVDERWEASAHQTLQRIEHVSHRTKADMNVLFSQVREVENFLAKTTEFQIRSSSNRAD